MLRILAAPLSLAIAILACAAACADSVRVASYNVGMQRKGPGLLLRDIRSGKDPAVMAAVQVIAGTAPDILALQRIDWDLRAEALTALADALSEAGVDYPYRFTARPNSGMASGMDLDGDGRIGDPAEAQGFGYFTGQGGIAVLSRFPIQAGDVQDFSGLLWRDFPDALLPETLSGGPFPSAEALDVQRLSSTAHWIVPVTLPDGATLRLLTFHAGPPVFDGPEDRNGRRNHDEVLFWKALLDQRFGPFAPGRFVLAGGANLDPGKSDGRREAIRSLLADPRFQDPLPGQVTVDWSKAGRFRVDYVLPSSDWTVRDAGVYWPDAGFAAREIAETASRHRLVWVDLELK